ncbi:MAG: sigma factor-like helix-turn-helix DNA-binding protein [Christensenellaceae bacterium]|jgi:predicted DNA-binding protein YlxM (UPF0122 family)
MKHEKDLNMVLYYDYYGDFLTEKQREAFSLYYNEDYSLAEIGRMLDISRQGAQDTIRRAEKKMKDMEEKLGLIGSGVSEESNGV